jgi:hypothetical protein
MCISCHDQRIPKSEVFLMNEELQRIFDSVPEDAPRSPLEPYRELILRWRRQGRSYRRICQMLNDRCKVKVAYAPLYRFVQRRSRPRKTEPKSEPQLTIAPGPQSSQTAATARLTPRRSPEELVAMREAIRASHNKPTFRRQEGKRLFTHDPDRIITNKPTEKEK